MKFYKIYIFIVFVFFVSQSIFAQNTELVDEEKSVELQHIISKYETLKHEDSIKFALLELQLKALTDSTSKAKSGQETPARNDSSAQEVSNRIEELKARSIGYPVVLERDTLFLVFTKRGDSTPKERAASIAAKIILISDNDFFNIDSLVIVKSFNSTDIVYQGIIVMSISKVDELWMGRTQFELATEYLEIIKSQIVSEIEENSVAKQLTRLAKVLGLLSILIILILILNRLHRKVKLYLINKSDWYNKLSFNNYSLISKEYFDRVIVFLVRIIKWLSITTLIYFFLAISFELYPSTRHLTHNLLQVFLVPLHKFGIAFIDYLPNLVVIILIYLLFRFTIKGLRFIFNDVTRQPNVD